MEKICIECGCIIENDEYIETANGDYVCEDCRDDYFCCDDCGEYFHNDYCVEVYNSRYGTEYVCEECADNNYMRCDNCGEYTDDFCNTRDGIMCVDCMRDYYWCEECEEYVHGDEYDFDAEMCYSCAERNVIKPYHYHKDEDPLFYISADRTTWSPRSAEWFMGIEWELETSTPEHDARELQRILGDRAYYERDCSVRGFETIFQPHTFEAILKSDAIREAFDYARDNLVANSHTGLHIHVSRCAFGSTKEEQEDHIAKLVALHTDGFAFDSLVKLARREDLYYCEAINSRRKDKDEAKDYVDGYGGHSVAFNCGNRATVEFRIAQSTTDYDEFIAWVKIVKMLVEASKKIDFEDAENFYVWFADADDTIKAYMSEHGVLWEEPMEITVDNYKKIISKLCSKINDNLDAQGLALLSEPTILALIANANMQERVSLGYRR